MKTRNYLLILALSVFSSACSSVHFKGVELKPPTNTVNYKHTVVDAISVEDNQKISAIYNALMSMGPNIQSKEAKFIARESVLYPKVLANQYGLVSPPLWHNVLVNYKRRPRGLCYQWTRDMYLQLGKPLGRNSTSFDYHHAVAYKGNYWREHSTLVVSAKGKPMETGILLDPWRNSGTLFWSFVKQDSKYPWKEFNATDATENHATNPAKPASVSN